MATISPLITDEAIEAAFARLDPDRPIAMLNLLRFRTRALYPAGSGERDCSGAEAYARYIAGVAPLVEAAGGHVILEGALWMIGPADEWDRAFVVRYDRPAGLIALGTHPDYLTHVHHRQAALADSRLLLMTFDTHGL